MASITIRNVPDAVHRALRARAERHGISTEDEIRALLEQATRPENRLKLGSLLVSIAGEAGGLTAEEAARFDRTHDTEPVEPRRFE